MPVVERGPSVNAKDIFELVKETFKEWSDDKAARLGAALAYYTIFRSGRCSCSASRLRARCSASRRRKGRSWARSRA